jgi:proline iminopeptidase
LKKSALFTLLLFVVASLLISTSAVAQINKAALSPGSHKVQLGDVRIHYVVSGNGPLLFDTAMGWGYSTVFNQNAFKPLEKHFTIVYVEVRGNGESSLPPDMNEMNQSDFAGDIDRLRIYLGLDKINLMGHSGGGSITLEYAEDYPTHLEKGILIAPAVFGDHDEKLRNAYLDLWQDDPKYKNAVKAARNYSDVYKSDADATKALDSIIRLYFSDPDRYLPIFNKQAGHSQVSAVTEKAYWAAISRRPPEQQKRYGAIQAKLLILNGTVDWVCTYEVAERLHQAVQGSVLELYANVGHFPYIEEPDRFFHEVTSFLSE